MANPILVSAAASGVQKGIKDIKSIGQKILSEIFGCKIKPKGTPYLTIYNKAPKFWGSYGTFYSTDGRQTVFGKSGHVVFDIVNGGIMTDTQIDAIFPKADRRAIEATLRKKCETVIGGYGIYVKDTPFAEDRGIVRLSDGHLYVGSMYSLEGGSRANPTEYNMVTPIGLSAEQAKESGKVGAGTKLAGFELKPAWILGGLAMFVLPAMLKQR
jgi:hypothetical protein